MQKQQSTALPIAFKRSDRELLQAAAARLGLAESTFVRLAAVSVARAILTFVTILVPRWAARPAGQPVIPPRRTHERHPA